MIEDFKKEEILSAAKKWFRDVIAQNHIKNTKILSDPKEFNINPFLVKYLSRFLTGKCDPISIATVLVYVRVLGTSINTSFGQNIQKFISEVLGSFGSAVRGIDIEFFDQIDGRKKFCQIKLGPETINSSDVETIHQHFTDIKNLARTNNLHIGLSDLIVGVMYGEKSHLSASYKKLEKSHHYPVYIGEEFWQRLTGSENFYNELSTAISEIAMEFDGTHLLENTILKLAESSVIQDLAGE